MTWIDSTLPAERDQIQRMAITTHERIFLEDILEVLGYTPACIPPDSPKICRAWFFDERFRLNHPLAGRSGYGISVNVYHRVHSPADAVSFLQHQASHGRTQDTDGRERGTQGPVAHTPGPRQNVALPGTT